MLATTSCNTGQPFVKLDPAGQASILNYGLPSESCFNVNGYLEIKINNACFSTFATSIPDDNFWDRTKDFSSSQVLELLNDDIIGSSSRPSILNAQAIQRLSLVVPQAIKPTESSARAARNAQVQQLAKENEQVLIAGMPVDALVDQILKGKRPIIRNNFFGKPVISFASRPKVPQPKITLVLHYKVCTFATNYGAGKTVKTFSLLPGEQTTISITTFKHLEEKKSRAESILDSFSESSAQEFQATVEAQSGSESSSSSTTTNSAELSTTVGITLPATGKIEVTGGVSHSATSANTIAEHINLLNSSLDSHSSQASNNRDITINTEVSSTSITEQTESIVRQLKNINLSRVLNFVFRQLLQEYVTITYLDDVSIVFSNGYPESKRVAKLSNINDLLSEVLQDGPAGRPCENVIENTRKGIFRQLCNMVDYQGNRISFLECITETLNDCCEGSEPPIVNTYSRKVAGLSQTAEGKTVPGIILDVKKRILRTDSLVVDALLGQGEALDCYNQHLQSIAVDKAQLDNDQQAQQLAIVNAIPDPEVKADKYKKIFGPCCDVPQTCGCSGSCTCTH